MDDVPVVAVATPCKNSTFNVPFSGVSCAGTLAKRSVVLRLHSTVFHPHQKGTILVDIHSYEFVTLKLIT